ncbi:hypothetical protein CLU81_3724 [Flavobacterium sp. 9]|uniref:hypothetical protein n=1 Tax=Flavobacterium sp. 9 TaxID=2035198 RepID=UPI000C3BE280|nr:hypothetical protein [Flavobacterium sp. 9]PIF33148.1 hypothetical protein CLU81_3724 [Flavobacterium sp. 9]
MQRDVDKEGSKDSKMTKASEKAEAFVILVGSIKISNPFFEDYYSIDIYLNPD